MVKNKSSTCRICNLNLCFFNTVAVCGFHLFPSRYYRPWLCLGLTLGRGLLRVTTIRPHFTNWPTTTTTTTTFIGLVREIAQALHEFSRFFAAKPKLLHDREQVVFGHLDALQTIPGELVPCVEL